MFSIGFVDHWNNMPRRLLKKKRDREFYLYSDRVMKSFMWGYSCIIFGPAIYGAQLLRTLQAWEYEKM